MKQTKTPGFKPLASTEMKQLCTTVRETKLDSFQLKKFAVVDLWSVHKVRKSTLVRSNIWI